MTLTSRSRIPTVRRPPAPNPRTRRPAAVKFLVPEIVFGPGMLSELGSAVRRMGGNRALLVSDEGVIAAGWVDRAVSHLRDAGVDLRIWHSVTPNPKDHEVEQGHATFRESQCDVVVAVGGGSCIDAAKAIAILTSSGGRIADYAGIDRVPGPVPPLIMAPSTAGSGADVSQFCVITDTARRMKLTIADRSLVPNVSVVDPTLLSTMSPELTAHTGIDALSHAIEAYVSLAANFLSDDHALAAIRGITEHLPVAVEQPDNPGARVGLARASLHAGLAFGNALLGATHAISHQIGGYLDIPHGLLNAILLPHVIRFNGPACPQRYADVAAAMGVAPGLRPEEAADCTAERVRLLADKLGIPAGLECVGVGAQDIPRFAEQALTDAYIATNPRVVTTQDVAALCRAAL